MFNRLVFGFRLRSMVPIRTHMVGPQIGHAFFQLLLVLTLVTLMPLQPVQAAGAASNHSVAEILLVLAERFPRGEKSNGMTTTSITSNGNRLRFNHQVEDSANFSRNMLSAGLAQNWCSKETLLDLFNRGAVFENTYRTPNGAELGFIKVDKTACEAFQAIDAFAAGRPIPPHLVESVVQNLADNAGQKTNAEFSGMTTTASGKTLNRIIHVTGGARFSLNGRRRSLSESICTTPMFFALMAEGVVFDTSFTRPDGEELGMVRLHREACEAYTNVQ
jgi:hypothetical protein